MTVNESLVTEIEKAVEQTIEDEKGFEEKNQEEITPKEEVNDEGQEKVKDENEDESAGVGEAGSSTDDEGLEAGIQENAEGEEKDPKEVPTALDPGKPPAISEGVLGLAAQAGFSAAEAQSFGSEGTLLKVIQMVADRKEPVKKEEQKQVPLLGDLPELDPEQYEPEAIETFKKMKDAIQKQQEVIEQLVQGTQQFQENQAAQNEREIESWFDQKVTGLGKNYEKTLGQGSYGDLSQGSSQIAKRDEIAEHISLLAAGYESTGRESPPLDVLFDQAAKFILQDDISEVKERQLSDRLRKRAKQHIARNGTEKLSSMETEEASDRELAGEIDSKFFKGN